MRRRRSQLVVGWICAALFIVTGTLVGAPSLVLCVGTNEHVALELTEISHRGACPSSPSPRESAEIDAATRPSSACVDILLIGSVAPDQPRPLRPAPIEITPLVLATCSLDALMRPTAVASPRVPNIGPRLSSPPWRILVLQI